MPGRAWDWHIIRTGQAASGSSLWVRSAIYWLRWRFRTAAERRDSDDRWPSAALRRGRTHPRAYRDCMHSGTASFTDARLPAPPILYGSTARILPGGTAPPGAHDPTGGLREQRG